MATYRIGPSGSADYATITAWAADIPANDDVLQLEGEATHGSIADGAWSALKTGVVIERFNVLDPWHIDATGKANGLIFWTNWSVSGGRVTGATGNGIHPLSGTPAVIIEDVQSDDNGGHGIYAVGNTGAIRRVKVRGNGGRGIYIISSRTPTLEAIEATGNAGGYGIYAPGCTLDGATVADNTGGTGGYAVDLGTTGAALRVACSGNSNNTGIRANTYAYCLSYGHAVANFDAGGSAVTSPAVDMLEVAPVYVGAPDYGPGDGSPLIGAGGTTSVTSDADGTPYLDPASIGAYEVPFSVDGATFTSLTTVDVTFTAAPSSTTVDDASEWSAVAAASTSAEVAVIAVEVDGETVTLTVHPEATPGASYTFTALSALSSGGVSPSPAAASASAPTSSTPEPPGAPWGLLRAKTHALGRALGALLAVPSTVLASSFVVGASVAVVESAHRWPSAGAFVAEGRRYTYTGRTDATLTGVALDSGYSQDTAMGPGVELVLDPSGVGVGVWEHMPLIERLRRSLLLSRAEGARFDELCRLVGFPRPAYLDRDGWRDAARYAATGPMERRAGCILPVVEAALRQHETDVSVTTSAASPQRITRASGTFSQNDVGRLIRIGASVYWSTGPEDVAAAGGTYIDLCPIATSYWHAAQFDDGEATATILPFTLHEPSPGPVRTTTPYTSTGGRACLVVLRVFASASEVPGSYIRADATVAGPPFDAYILADEFVEGESPSPTPIYLDVDDTMPELRSALETLLASGVHAESVRGL